MASIASTVTAQTGLETAAGTFGHAPVATLAYGLAAIDGTQAPAGFPAKSTIADGATVTQVVDPLTKNAFGQVTLGGNRTLAITGAVKGSQGILLVAQDGTGSRTLALPSNNLINAAYTPTTTATTGLDMLNWTYDGTNFIFGVPAKALTAH